MVGNYVHIYSYLKPEDFTPEEEFKEYQSGEFRDIILSVVDAHLELEYDGISDNKLK